MKKAVKLLGNAFMIAALVFIVKKFISMDIDPAQFRSPRTIAALAVGFIVQTAVIICSCFPWLVFTRALSGRRIPFSAAMPVYTQSNLYKYIPGNVFQYVGRNKLAADMDISHVDVAFATLLDIFFCVLWTGLAALVLLGGRIASILSEYGGKLLIVGGAGVLALAVLILIVRLKFRDKLAAYLSRYAETLRRSDRKMIAKGAFYYLGQNIVSAAAYFACLTLIVGKSAGAEELIALTGAFMFAWIIGFVTPGAPGGIGIREGVMIFVCGDRFAEKVILFVLVMRIGSILADITAFVIGKICEPKRQEEKSTAFRGQI